MLCPLSYGGLEILISLKIITEKRRQLPAEVTCCYIQRSCLLPTVNRQLIQHPIPLYCSGTLSLVVEAKMILRPHSESKERILFKVSEAPFLLFKYSWYFSKLIPPEKSLLSKECLE